MKFSDKTIEKARALVLAGDRYIQRDAEFDGIWHVLSSDETQTYRVQTDYSAETGTLSWITCTCPHGLNVGAGMTSCYHAAAVLIRLRDGRRKAQGQVTPASLIKQ